VITVIDFETANADRGSICSVGVVVIRNGVMFRPREVLIKPHCSCRYFSPFNIQIHGITPDRVCDAPEWGEFFPKLAPYLEGATVVAHNAAFDISVLRKGLELYGLPTPHFDFFCTCKAAKRLWPELENHKLNTLAARFGHQFRHHNAAEDAEAAAVILNAMFKETGTSDCRTLGQHLGITPGTAAPGIFIPIKMKKIAEKR
jgi:DNA polymerase-3 subunit epsilon